MNQEAQWLLPDGVEEVLPGRARAIEQLRRRTLDLYQQWGYELVFPPLIEFLESLLNGAGRDLERETFKITDQLTGRLMGVRADITPQVARMDAHSLRQNAPTRLCYCSSALRTRPAVAGGTRLPYQIGVELFGHAGVDSDLEVISLLLETLKLSGLDQDVVLDLGHVGLFRGLVEACEFSEADQYRLEDIYVRKARVELETFVGERDLPAKAGEALLALPWLAGGAAVLEQARTLLSNFPAALDALTELSELVDVLSAKGINLHLDLGELRGYHYHTGSVFAAYLPGESEPLAKGGRYDHIGEVFGRARPATGFSADLKMLAAQLVTDVAGGILAEGSLRDAGFAASVAALRERGERVVLALPGADNDPQVLGCQRKLVQADNGWIIQDL
ncbi:MAG: ATP phosphoribosyltransferase regulatory subunit [Pseudomonadota bacterium]|uniref:ATP phosphoribosyltransferase regulatory subunit n=1 Tax=Alcanivorax sp. TaxID=1872427 RepID=UPI0025B7CB06|nr:ATP phosphoribosyltransferase regulatory subunit [Alcanivorax sp.]MED5238415.1 ATP phosphoribosyltransferase regulatory subunit [Pseudomonadota bacterium]MEE3319586.1 ATP phosphoribosyltransferase regulatory subunit [Pseudomonadota bacterium]